MITANGFYLVRDLLKSTNPGSITRVEIGTDGTTATVNDTALIGTTYGETATESEPTTTSVMFSINLGTSEGNGTGTLIYQEEGLRRADEIPQEIPVGICRLLECRVCRYGASGAYR